MAGNRIETRVSKNKAKHHLVRQGKAEGTYRAVPAGEAAGKGPFSMVVTKQK